MKITLAVDTGNGPVQVTTSFWNVIEWERKTKKTAGSLAQGIGAEDLTFLAWAASKSSGLPVPPTFDDYARKVISLEVVTQEDANPTHEGHTAAV
jgi:hypothetical protein